MESGTRTDPVVTQVFTKRNDCRICGKPIELKLSLGDQYLVDFPKEKDATLPKAPLELCRCRGCGLLQLGHTVNPDLLYREFWYRSSVNQTMRDALLDVVQHGLQFVPQPRSWLDIGANDGYLLSRVPKDCRTIAVEPALNFAGVLQEHCNRVVSEYFTGLDEKVDVITSIAMFYDLEDPSKFVGDIAKTLTDEGVWVNQLNHAPGMLKTNAFDAICHEHLCYYDVPALKELYGKHGLRIISVGYNEINGGSVRVVACKIGAHLGFGSTAGTPRTDEDEVHAFAERVQRWKEITSGILYGLPGPIWGYGASTKGSTMLQYLDGGGMLVGIADRNPAKSGRRMVGSWIPITDEVTMRRARPRHLLVLPWSFRQEFVLREAELRAKGTTMLFPLPHLEFVL